MSDIQGQPAELRFTLSVTRAATGQVEHFEMVGHVVPDPTQQETSDGNDSLDGGAQRGD